MQKAHYSIQIDAPKEKVWHAMLDDATYREWTKPFNPGSYYEGSWDQGSEMRFLGTDDEGKKIDGGMYSRIKENRRYEFISIEHIGMIKDGIVDTTSEEVKKWVPSFENYTFTEKAGGTEVSVDIDLEEEFIPSFNEMWQKALGILKEIAER